MSESGYTTADGKFHPMPDGRWRLVFDANTGESKGVYFTPEENAQRDAEEAAYEHIRLANIKKAEISQAIQELAPQLRSAFSSLTQNEQVEFAGDFDTVERRLNNGEVAFARAIIAAKKPLTPNGTSVQVAMVAGLDGIIALMEGE